MTPNETLKLAKHIQLHRTTLNRSRRRYKSAKRDKVNPSMVIKYRTDVACAEARVDILEWVFAMCRDTHGCQSVKEVLENRPAYFVG